MTSVGYVGSLYKDWSGLVNFRHKSFIENAHRGRNCCYFFIRKGQKIYPVMPRKWLTVIYDKWGFIFRDNYLEITKRFDKSKPNVLIGIKIGHFISDRIDNDHVFTLVAPINADMNPHDLIILQYMLMTGFI